MKKTSESATRPNTKDGSDNDKIMDELDSQVQQMRENLIHSELAEFAGKYEHTDNPLYVWRAIHVCCDKKFEFPEWVRNYLLDSAEELLEISGADGSGAGEASKRIAAALEMDSRRGHRNVFARYEDLERDFDEGIEFPEARAVARNNDEVYAKWAKDRSIEVDSVKKRVQRIREKNKNLS